MPRISALEIENADPKAQTLLNTAKKKMGMVPNLFKSLAHSPTALESYLTMSSTLGEGTLSPKTREQIAVATAGFNHCEYCASAHTTIGKSLKIEGEELALNLKGESNDPQTRTLLSFVGAVLESRGEVSNAQLQAIRDAGYTEGQIAEIVANIALNTLTNYFNNIARTEIDFPKVELKPETAACAC